MSRLHQFERLIDQKLRGLFRTPASEGERRELIEVHRAILEEIASHAEMLPRGRRTFAYPKVAVQVLLPDPERRRAYEVVFVEASTLEKDVRARLEEDEVELPERLEVSVELVGELPLGIAERGFDVSYSPAVVTPPGPGAVPEIRLTVLHGIADREEYVLRKRRVNLGRLGDVLDSNQRLLRRNDVAFQDAAEAPNSTVSRTHAHLEYDSGARQFRLFDDHSALGTTILREGAFVNVPRGPSKGAALEAGDEIVLGQVRLRFEILGH